MFSSMPPIRSVTASTSEGRTSGGSSSNRQVEFGDAISLFFKNFVNFHGRSSRGAYWWWVLANNLGWLVVGFIIGLDTAAYYVPSTTVLLMLALLGLVIGHFSLAVRRLHDTNRTGWWFLIGLVPLVGAIVLIIFFCTPGTRGPNTYGPDVEAGR